MTKGNECEKTVNNANSDEGDSREKKEKEWNQDNSQSLSNMR